MTNTVQAPGPTTRERLLQLVSLAYDQDDPAIPWDERCVMAGDLAAVKDLCGKLLDRILSGLYHDLPEWEMRMDGVGTFTKTKGTKRKGWDHERAAAVVAARAADDLIEDVPPAVLADHVMRELLSCAGISYWRKGEMRRRNLDADNFCDTEEGTPTVVFKPFKAAE